MPVTSSQSLPAQLGSSGNADALAFILGQKSYVTNLDQFLAEHDEIRAMSYWLREFVPGNVIRKSGDIPHAINRAIADIDQLINEQLNVILHDPKFQKLEASWRGLWHLAEQAQDTQDIKIRFLDISWAEVSKDIGRALEFDQSQLFNKIYNEEFGTPGGTPYGVIIGDYEVSHRTSEAHPFDDVATLEGLAQIAAAAFAPMILSASSDLFGMSDFSGLGMPIKLENVFVQTEYIRWRALREKPDTRFIGLVAPRILMRRPYLRQPGSYKGIYFHEQCVSQGREHYLWGNAAYAFGAILIREFASVGWFGHIRGVPRGYLSGGLVTTLPVDYFDMGHNHSDPKPVTDVIITDTVEQEMSMLGFIPLCQCYQSTFAAFYNNQSVHLPRTAGSNEARINAKLASMLQHVLCASRVAHYIKIMIRDKIGSFASAEECERYLQDWLSQYTNGTEDMDWQMQARFPLNSAAVQVREHPMKPGSYGCVIHLRPHYQVDNMASELELVTELAAVRK